jgi:hypothetical protein
VTSRLGVVVKIAVALARIARIARIARVARVAQRVNARYQIFQKASVKNIKDRITVGDKWLLQVAVAQKIALMRNILREMDR